MWDKRRLTDADMRESDVKREVKRRLDSAGWFCTDTSQNKITGGGLRGLPDLVCVRRNTTVFIETKRTGGQRNQNEIDWFAQLAPHCGNNLYYVCCDHPDGVPGWMYE